MKPFNLFVTLLAVLVIGFTIISKSNSRLGGFTLVVPQGGTGATSFTQYPIVGAGGTGALTSSSSPTVVTIMATSTTATSTFEGQVLLNRAGRTLTIRSGINNSIGRVALVSGEAVVNSNIVTATSTILLVPQDGTTNAGSVWVSARTAGTSFTITSTNILDARTVGWFLIEPQ